MPRAKITLLNPLTHRLHKVVLLMDKIADQVLQKNLDLTFSQFRILLVLDAKPETTAATIAKYHGLSAAAISRQIEILKAKKLIFIKPNSKNRRQHFLVLTPSGKTGLYKALKVLNQVFKEIYGLLSEGEKKRLIKNLDQMAQFIQKKGIQYFCK